MNSLGVRKDTKKYQENSQQGDSYNLLVLYK